MATWDDVDVDFGDDETVNFGPRIESGSSLYLLNTDATISARGGTPLDSPPTVSACVGGEAVFVAANQQVNTIRNELKMVEIN